MSATNEAERKKHIHEFQRNAQRFLTDDDRDYLHDIMKEYQAHLSVDKLIQALKSCLDTPRKLDLLADIRNLIPLAQLSRFDSLAPYNKMAHPYRPTNQISPDRRTQNLNGQLKERQQNGRISPGGSPRSFKVITLAKTSAEQVLGFSIQGGRERGTYVYVSEVDSRSLAEKQGLSVGDVIIEVNGISFEHIALSSAVNLLSSLKKIKMVVKSQGKMPDLGEGMSRKNPWSERNGGASPDGNDSVQNSSTSSVGSHNSITLQPNSHLLNSDDERRVNLAVESTPTGFIGFNLRGGAEYGLGIYVSGVDPGSLAEQSGFRVGDQILDVNGKSFENVKHKEAVDFIKSHAHIIVTLKAVGKLPEAKHYTSEISWIYPDGTIAREGKENYTRSLSSPSPPVSPLELSHSSTQFPDYENNNIRMESPKPELREFGVQTPVAKIDSDTQTLDEVPVRDVQQEAKEKLERTQSSKSVATTCSSSSADTEKRQSVHSSSFSIDSTNSREDLERKYLAAGHSGAFSAENINIQATASDSEAILQDETKRKVKKSKSFLQKHGDKIKSKLSFRKKSKPKMEQKGGGPSKQQLLLYVEERAKKILVVDEYNVLIKHIKNYMDDSDVETLVQNLLSILDKPEKALLLRDIRTLISSYDLGRFDAMVSAREKDALEYLSMFVPGSPSILPTQVEKPKRQLISVIQDSRGGFQIRSKEELEKMKREREREEQAKAVRREWLGGNILDRQARIGTSDYYAVQSTTPDAIEMVPVKDTGMPPVENISNPSPMTLSVPVIQVNNDDNELEVPMETKPSSNTLLVPDRVAVEYKDDDDDDDVPMGGGQSAFVAVPSTSAASTSGSESLILLPKNRTSLGISISGGKGTKTQPEIRVEKIFPGGAAHDDGRLKSGDEIISVDGTSMRDVTHAEAVDIIRRSYNDKSKRAMHITVIPKQ
ncbi:PDZ domain-containing protein 7-like [Actinia tenebrosa]|uniref:PDZ domain-containing protein 7-like n=1 Tax=Actinia tenebrosa TaxID=6105 RepID=A0A6P8HKB0_ACTTE|nr:PDZ domain-containing protein 7-like [Actinia tenebrosa]